ncbi:amidoligase enzyme domain-containing protein [Pochonia chlamydosporia 170]|uniref:Amidoligase enzyme domain-containing protein n=1 Tax=Pochonia chlamydosporia 170 TaxID=1380566 RepID=A0A179FN86_METCM|nr:amidoligase enzyme domain-containing protein [Pochonia chlamydosporia 170]OAQ67115.1 amidoligase enzyme domain-containing protein [Pochonia chlamydosporia 170]
MSEQIRFGVEFEMVVRPKEETIKLLESLFEFDHRDANVLQTHDLGCTDRRVPNRNAIVRFIESYLRQTGIEVNDSSACKKFLDDVDYTKWTVTTDPSITESGLGYGIEIISPVLISNLSAEISKCTGTWNSEMEMVWTAVEKYFDIVTETRHRCGTHVHMSPLLGFSTEQVRRFARFLYYLHSDITEHIPESRRKMRFSQPNFDIRPKPSLDELAEDVPLEQLISAMMPRLEDMQE